MIEFPVFLCLRLIQGVEVDLASDLGNVDCDSQSLGVRVPSHSELVHVTTLNNSC